MENIMSRISPGFPFLFETVCTKDSQEITDADREDILRFVVEGDQQLILITHGTDTMCETARYLVRAGVGQGSNFGPGVGEKVVAITGAFKPECMKDTDADFNVGFALGFLQASSAPGVYVVMNGCAIPGAHAIRNQNGKFVDDRDVLSRF
ncbi:uncharacterized protein LOC101853170 isoform X2 [Aplysia californica]|nr:uncharacterized protein LOC101853170 isoform X2 [Aplysia californica]